MINCFPSVEPCPRDHHHLLCFCFSLQLYTRVHTMILKLGMGTEESVHYFHLLELDGINWQRRSGDKDIAIISFVLSSTNYILMCCLLHYSLCCFSISTSHSFHCLIVLSCLTSSVIYWLLSLSFVVLASFFPSALSTCHYLLSLSLSQVYIYIFPLYCNLTRVCFVT